MYESETCCFVQFGWFGAHSVSSVHIRCTFERFQIESGVKNDGGSGMLLANAVIRTVRVRC